MDFLLNTQMHWLTLVLTVLETMLLVFYEFPVFLAHPQERHRVWFMILLVLLIHFNLWNGLLPDPKHFSLSLKVQYILLDGIAYLMGAYFPWYFYKAFELDSLRFYATYGVLLFLVAPYILFVAVYSNNGMPVDRLIYLPIPVAFGLVVLVAIYRSIDQQYKLSGDKWQYAKGLVTFIAVMPWEAMCVFAFRTPPQELKIMMANLGFLALALLNMAAWISSLRKERAASEKKEVEDDPPPPDFLGNCEFYVFSEMETEVAGYARQGLSNKEIAERILRSEETVKSHISSCLKKTRAKSRSRLVYLLEHKRPEA